MKLRNNGTSPFGFNVIVNLNETVEIVDGEGNKVVRKALPKSEFVYIPSQATVELDDKLWKAAISAKTDVQEWEEVEMPIGHDDFGQASIGERKLTKLTRIPTGVKKTISLVQSAVDSGILTVLSKPKLNMSRKQLIDAVEGKLGFPLPADIEDDKLLGMYERNVG